MGRFEMSVVSLSLVVGCWALAGCDGVDTPPSGGNGGGNGLCVSEVDCGDDEICVSGVCEPVQGACVRDSDCREDQRCDTLSGACVPVTGNGEPEYACDSGETRCAGTETLESCDAARTGWEASACEAACFDGACVTCYPGDRVCDADVARTCNATGSGWDEVDCAAAGGSCDGGICQVCTPGDQRCAGDWEYEVCNSTGSGWDTFGCLDALCDPDTGACGQAAEDCEPGLTRSCEGTNVVICADDGESWDFLEDCAASGGGCANGFCTDLCAQAVASNSYIGCEYWPVVLSNTQLDSAFHSDYAVVVANPNEGVTAEVNVYRHGQSAPVATTSVAGGALEVIHLPWNQMPARRLENGACLVWVIQGVLCGVYDQVMRSRTQKSNIAYRLESSVPVTAYQFNPLRSQIGSEYSHTNDASLLLPTHVYGYPSRYIAIALPHKKVNDHDSPTFLAIVGTEDDTQVNIRLRGYAAGGGGLGELGPGSQTTVTLNRHEVLQIASRAAGGNVRQAEASGRTVQEFRDSDMSGTMIDANKPVAVFSGADCRFVPYDQFACDHMEQQLFPFQNWGDSYVGAVTEPPPGGAASAGDFWRIVAAIDGTQLTFTPGVHANVTLGAGQWVEFQTHQHFKVSTQGPDHPIMVSQFLIGQNAHGSTMGDPSMILAVPTGQYLNNFHFTTPSTIARNYVNAIRPSGATVAVNGTPLPSGCWQNVTGTDYQVCRHEVPGGTHSVTASAPIGLTVYGFDSYVSYGYPAGLDLESLVDVNPGW